MRNHCCDCHTLVIHAVKVFDMGLKNTCTVNLDFLWKKKQNNTYICFLKIVFNVKPQNLWNETFALTEFESLTLKLYRLDYCLRTIYTNYIPHDCMSEIPIGHDIKHISNTVPHFKSYMDSL